VSGEIQKKRPALNVSNDASNKYLNRVQVVPLTSQVERVYPSEAEVILNGRPNKAMADQLTTVSKMRLTKLADRLTSAEIKSVEHAIRIQLGLSGA
jgi:mRNA interferase MazF